MFRDDDDSEYGYDDANEAAELHERIEELKDEIRDLERKYNDLEESRDRLILENSDLKKQIAAPCSKCGNVLAVAESVKKPEVVRKIINVPKKGLKKSTKKLIKKSKK
jgi:ArsR family metal-binding transcriptional regulator